MKIILIPGNGNSKITEIWFPYVKKGLIKLGLTVIAKNMPDPDLARKKYWLPFIVKQLGTDDAILIGHSSGAVAIMRYLETHTCQLAILVGAYYTDLGDEHEKKSGYFNTPWQWAKIKQHTQRIIVFASQDDPYVPIAQARFIKDKLDAEYHEYLDEGHFGEDVNKVEFPELITVVSKLLQRKTKL